MHFIIFFLLIKFACALSLKFPFFDLPGDDAFLKPYKINTMEIKCQSNASDNGQNVAINIDHGRIGKFVENERLKSGQLMTRYVDKFYSKLQHSLAGLKFLQPEAPDCDFINWKLMIEEKDECRTINAILRNVPAGKDDLAATLAWIHRIMSSPPSASANWRGIYFPNSKFLDALNIRFIFIVEWNVIIEPENYLPMLNQLQKMPKFTMENAFTEHEKMMNQIQKTPLVNFDEYFLFLLKHIFTEKVKINGRMPYSKNLLNYIANGSCTQLSIDRTHGSWPKEFFDKLINLIETDSFGPVNRDIFGFFNVHIDLENAVPWPNVGKFKMVGVERKVQEIGLESVKYVWKGRKRWTMILSTTDRFNTFINFLLHTDRYAGRQEQIDKFLVNAGGQVKTGGNVKKSTNRENSPKISL